MASPHLQCTGKGSKTFRDEEEVCVSCFLSPSQWPTSGSSYCSFSHLETETGAHREVRTLPKVTKLARTEILTLSGCKLETTLMTIKLALNSHDCKTNKNKLQFGRIVRMSLSLLPRSNYLWISNTLLWFLFGFVWFVDLEVKSLACIY